MPEENTEIITTEVMDYIIKHFPNAVREAIQNGETPTGLVLRLLNRAAHPASTFSTTIHHSTKSK